MARIPRRTSDDVVTSNVNRRGVLSANASFLRMHALVATHPECSNVGLGRSSNERPSSAVGANRMFFFLQAEWEEQKPMGTHYRVPCAVWWLTPMLTLEEASTCSSRTCRKSESFVPVMFHRGNQQRSGVVLAEREKHPVIISCGSAGLLSFLSQLEPSPSSILQKTVSPRESSPHCRADLPDSNTFTPLNHKHSNLGPPKG